VLLASTGESLVEFREHSMDGLVVSGGGALGDLVHGVSGVVGSLGVFSSLSDEDVSMVSEFVFIVASAYVFDMLFDH